MCKNVLCCEISRRLFVSLQAKKRIEIMSRTYISLFSCAGVGCYGFKMQGFECVASNELLAPRIEVQKCNHKCKYESGYICGDATKPETHQRIYDEIAMWKEKEGLEQVDVVFATPPCQGMSTANYKKTDHEQIRNSLVVEAIKLIKGIHPKVFVFENVRAFMKSICTDLSGDDMLIKESIYKNLSEDYNIYWKVINFKDYGVPSSRPRTIVIGTSKELRHTTPLQLFPTRQNEILLRDSIGGFPRLAYCEKDKSDPFHFARPFPEYMLDWIKDLKEGETAFDNPDETKPYQLDKDGNKIVNKGAYMGNKYRRLIWDRPGACIATRSDIMSSQDTIHPCDNRVLSIRELMTLMTIPNSFQWTDHDSQLTVENSDEYLRDNEGNIRRCIGEAVPTQIGKDIAGKIKQMLDYEDYVNSGGGDNANNFYIAAHRCFGEILPHDAFAEINKQKEVVENISVKVVGIRDFLAFVPQLISYYSHINSITIDVFSLTSEEEINLLSLLGKMNIGSNVHINIPERAAEFESYNMIVENGKCRHFFATILGAKRPVKKPQADPLQLSLF